MPSISVLISERQEEIIYIEEAEAVTTEAGPE